MSRLYAIVEGQTEQAFIREVVGPFLAALGIYMFPVLVGKPGHKGGVRSFYSVASDISKLLKQERNAYVTTLFDRYALPPNWPGFDVCQPDMEHSVVQLNLHNSMQQKILEDMGADFDGGRFIPYIQFYELETFLFCDPKISAEILGAPHHEEALAGIVLGAGNCEGINGGPETSPSKRIQKLFPNYKKGRGFNAHLPRICSSIGIGSIRGQCPLFHRWLSTLEALPN